jgi:hypothetical protein
LELLTCRQFIGAIVNQCPRYTYARVYQPLVTHILWGAIPAPLTEEQISRPSLIPDFGAPYVVNTIANIVRQGMKAYEHDEARCLFHFSKLVVDVAGDSQDGSAQAARIDAICTAIVTGLYEQKQYFRATELGIENFTQLAKNRPLVRQWMVDNADQWKWCEEWYRRFERFPTVPGSEMRMLKRQQHSYYNYQNQYASMRDYCTYHNIRALLDGAAPEFERPESEDEGAAAVGRKVTLSLQNNRQIRATVDSFDAQRGEHVLRMEDGSTRFHNLLDVKTATTMFDLSAEFKAGIQQRSLDQDNDTSPAEEGEEGAGPDSAPATAPLGHANSQGSDAMDSSNGWEMPGSDSDVEDDIPHALSQLEAMELVGQGMHIDAMDDLEGDDDEYPPHADLGTQPSNGSMDVDGPA